jgi:hypothetical protein
MARSKPTVYLDTNILSVLCYQGVNISAIYQQMATREWWDTERRWFLVYASSFTEDELMQGSYRAQQKALKLVRRLPYLPFLAAIRECAESYLEKSIIPKERPGDAVQLAFATVHRIDYPLTWNYAHLANLDTQRRFRELHAREGRRTPFVVTPETIPHVSLGQAIRRKKNGNEN